MSAQNAVNEAIEDIVSMMNEAQHMAIVRRGALSTGDSITCEIGPSVPLHTFLNKHEVIPLDITINGKSADLQRVTQALSDIHYALVRRTTYPAGIGWEITDISDAVMPQIIGRETNNDWLVASQLTASLHIM